MKKNLSLLLSAMLLTSCVSERASNFSGVDPALTVPPTQVMVLGTTHLAGHSDDIALADLELLLERLERYAPDVITTEDSSGMTCQRARAFPLEHDGYADDYCLDGEPYRAEPGLSVAEGSFRARTALLDWPESPSAGERKQLAAYGL